MVKVKLSPGEIELLNKPVRGEGGRESLLLQLQGKLTKDGSIEISQTEIERITRYCLEYGGGGFQERFCAIYHALKRV